MAFIPKYDRNWRPESHIRIEAGEFAGMLARPEYFALSSEEHARICNGIGAASGITKNMPSTIWGLDCEECGNIHDFDYDFGGSQSDKDTADRVFLHNLRTRIRKGCWLLRIPRERRALEYYLALQIGGKTHFNFHD